MASFFLLASTPGADLRPVAERLRTLGIAIALVDDSRPDEGDPATELFEFQGHLLALACQRTAMQELITRQREAAAIAAGDVADDDDEFGPEGRDDRYEGLTSALRDRVPAWGWNRIESFDPDRFIDEANLARPLLKAAAAGAARWGWGDARSTLLLDFWHDRLPDGRYVLVYDTPWDAIANLCGGAGAPLADHPEEALQIWCYYAAHLLDFFKRHRDRAVLLCAQTLRDRPETAIDLLAGRLGVEPPEITIAIAAEHPCPPLDPHHPLAAWVCQETPYALQWLCDLNAIADAPDDRVDQWQGWQTDPPRSSLMVRDAIATPADDPGGVGHDGAPPQISVVIPCYNHGEFLLEAIASVHSCPRKVYEIIVVNDASTEPKTVAILAYLKSRGYRVIDCPENGGLSNARNRGIEAARAAYILPLDADNRIRANYIPRAIEIFDANPEVGVVYGNAEYIGDRVGPWIVADFDINLLAVGNYIDACAPIRKQVWADCGGYDPHIPDRLGYEDWDLWLSAAERGWEFHHLNEIAFEYRVRADSMVTACDRPDNRRRLMYYITSKHLDLYTTNFAAVFAYKDVELLEARQQTLAISGQISELQQERDRALANAQHYLSLMTEANLKLLPLQRQLPPLRREIATLHQEFQRIKRERDTLQEERDGLRHGYHELQRVYRQLFDLADATFAAMRTSKFWKLRDRWFTLKQPLRKLTGKGAAAPEMVDLVPAQLAQLAPQAPGPGAPASAFVNIEHPGTPEDRYSLWQRRNEPTVADLRRMESLVSTWPDRPKLSVLMPVYNPPRPFLEAAIASVRAQIYPHWQLCIVDDRSTASYVREVLETAAAADSRIQVKFRDDNGHIVAASNDALAMADGAFICLLDHDDVLAPHALYEVAHLLNARPDADWIYSDEDKIDENDRRTDPFFKPQWCPDTFLSRMYTCHLSTYRRSILTAIGGFRPGFEGAQDYDLALRFLEKTDPSRILHIPKVLYHWRIHSRSTAYSLDTKDYAATAARRALTEALDRRGEPAAVTSTGTGHWIVRYHILKPGRVTVIIPTRDLASMLDTCLSSIFERTDYENYEVLIVDNGSVEPETQALFTRWSKKERDRFRMVAYDAPFNYSKINNFGVENTDSPYLLFLNNDTEVIDGGWMTAMVEQAQRPSIGAVGATLLYPDRTLQHAGVVLGLGGVAGHSHKHYPHGDPGYGAQLKTINNYSAVTAACLMCRRDAFLEVGGFEPSLQVAFNDVDFCLKLLDWGYRNVHLPHVVLYHYESKSRGMENTPEKVLRFQGEMDYMRRRWHQLLDADPCYSPNLTRDREDFTINL